MITASTAPTFLRRGRCFLRLLIDNGVTAVVTSKPIPSDYLEKWDLMSKEIKYVVYYGDAADSPANSDKPKLSSVGIREAGNIFAALASLEKQFCADIDVRQAQPPERSDRESLTFIGAGIVNLISAHFATRAGMAGRFVDAAPTPARANWTRYGCSAGGANARMFTLSEMDNYNCRHVHDDMNCQFSRSVEQRGWTVCDANYLSQDEKVWIESFERIPSWLAESYNHDIFKFNRESKSLWELNGPEFGSQFW